MADTADSLARLVQAVRAAAKYRRLCPEVIEYVGARELAVRSSFGEALKATKGKLHQVGGAYVNQRMTYSRWLGELRQAEAEGKLQDACLRIMRAHASTSERLPILPAFYATVLGEIAPVHSVLDLACGLGPLAIPWMPLAPAARYDAYDMYEDLARFLGAFLALLGVPGKAAARDVLKLVVAEPVHVALLLKALPCLEQLDRTASAHLLEALPAQHFVISYPVHSLGGRAKGMIQHYDAHLQALLAGRPWKVRRFLFATELAFLVTR